MNAKPQVIFDNGKPAFVVLRYEDYMEMTGEHESTRSDDAEFIPFVLSNYLKNPIRVLRIEAGLNQQQLAKLLRVTQGYVSRIEARSFHVSDELLQRIKSAITKHKSHKHKARNRQSKYGS